MEKVLSQGEIDALFRAAGGAGTAADAGPLVEAWDLSQAGLSDKQQLHNVSQLHETFARNLTSALSGYLREKFEVALVAVEQLAYRDFLGRFPDVTYYSTFRISPSEARGIAHLDLSLAFPMVDLLLGGPGKMPAETREVTQIEESILQGVGEIICHELKALWEPLGLEAEFEKRQTAAQMVRLMPPQEKTLTLTFDISMTDSKGILNLAFPTVVTSTLLRKLGGELTYQQSRGPAVNQESIGRRMRNSKVDIELVTPPISVTLPELLSLRTGQVLPLRRRIDQPAALRIGGRDCWWARPVSSNRWRAAQLSDSVVEPE